MPNSVGPGTFLVREVSRARSPPDFAGGAAIPAGARRRPPQTGRRRRVLWHFEAPTIGLGLSRPIFSEARVTILTFRT